MRLSAIMVLLLGWTVSAGYGGSPVGNATLSPARGTSPPPVYQPPQGYYLALGDSIAYGFQPAKAQAGLPPSRFNTGYVDVFAARLRTIAPKLRVVNYGCPGESTKTFIR